MHINLETWILTWRQLLTWKHDLDMFPSKYRSFHVNMRFQVNNRLSKLILFPSYVSKLTITEKIKLKFLQNL